MSTISVSLPQDGTTADVADFGTPVTTIVTAINGNLDSNNIASLNGSKLVAASVPGSALDSNLVGGWITGLTAPSAVVANGNRSYSLTFSGLNYSTYLSPGMRFRTTRTVAAPTQCTSLNGTNQYYSKATPAGMTFTVTCTAMGWRKLNAYSAQWFGGRTTGTNGFRYGVNASGQLIFEVQPGNATTKTVTSYQSVPLTKGFRYAFQIDLAGTCQIMLDGVAIPSTTAGTATSLTQAVADFQLGAAGGVGFTNGKMAQDALFSVKLADATVLSYEGQSYIGTETSLISAYSFNNSINDLNTTNANNLTANGSAVATNADSPFGGQAGGSISSTLDYGIIQSVTFSTNTTVVVKVPEGCTIPTSGGVSAIAYSTQASPYGFSDNMVKNCRRLVYIPVGAAQSTTSTTIVQFNPVTNYSFTVPSDCTMINLGLYNASLNSGSTSNVTVLKFYNGAINTIANELLQINNTSSNSYVSLSQPLPVVPGETIQLNVGWETTAGTANWSSGGANRQAPAIWVECA